MTNTLEKMKATGIDVEDGEGTATPEPEEAEIQLVEEDGDTDELAGEPEPPEEPTDVVLDQDKADRFVSMPKHKLAKLRQSRREARDDADAARQHAANLQQQNEQLRRQQAQQKPKPTLESCEFDTATFETQLANWFAFQHQAPAPPQPQQYQPPQQQPQPGPYPPVSRPHVQSALAELDKNVESHYGRAEKLGIDLDKFADAEKAVRQVFGPVETDILITRLGDGSEKVMYFLGNNPDQLSRVQGMLHQDPSGLTVMSYLGELKASLKTSGKSQVSNAPKPDTAVGGGGISKKAALTKLQKQFDAADKKGDTQAMFKLRRQARKAGVSID